MNEVSSAGQAPAKEVSVMAMIVDAYNECCVEVDTHAIEARREASRARNRTNPALSKGTLAPGWSPWSITMFSQENAPETDK